MSSRLSSRPGFFPNSGDGGSSWLSAKGILIGLQFGVLVVAGAIGYSLSITNAISWVVWFLVGGLSLLVLSRRGSTITPRLLMLSLPFIVFLVMHLMVSGSPVALTIPVIRYFIIFYIVALALASVRAESLWDLASRLDVVLWFQLAALVLQHILVIPRSGNWDSAVGTFGGDPFGGGNSSGLGLYLCLMLGWTLIRYRTDLISGRKASALIVGVIICGALAETKMFVLVSPFVAVLAYRAELWRNPAKFVGILAGALGLLLLLAYLYWRIFYSSFIGDIDSFVAYMAPELMGAEILVATTGEVGRIEGLRYWWQQNSSDSTALLLGQGILSTQSSSVFGTDEVQTFQLGNTTASALLWETGLIGFLFYLLPFLAAFWVAGSRARRVGTKQRAALVELCFVSVAAWLPFLFQSLTQYQTVQSQMMGALILAAGFTHWRDSPARAGHE